MDAELIIFLLALVVALGGTAIGWIFGGAGIIRYLLATVFAVLVTLRYWYPASQALGPGVSIDPLYVAGGIFASIFIVAFAVAGIAVRFKAVRFQSVLSDPLDKTLGVLFGLALGVLLGGALLLDLSFFCAGFNGDFDTSKFPVRLDLAPVKVFTVIEANIAGVPDASKTILPIIKVDPTAKDTRVTLDWH